LMKWKRTREQFTMAWFTTPDCQHKKTPRENFFTGNGISPFADPELPLPLGLQTVPCPPKYKPVSLPKYNGYGHFRQFIMSYEAAVNSAGGDDVAFGQIFHHCLWRSSSQLVFLVASALNIQLNWSQDEIHSGISSVSWNSGKTIRPLQLQTKR
jgi:hypothetical protein